jgi:ketosteroid isomerase-like protein
MGRDMELDEFVTAYETALATQNWAAVEPLIHKDACVTFSSGTVHRGKDAVRRAFEGNFAAIADETYRISNVHWVRKGRVFAAYLFDFNWSGLIDGKPASGGGRGTCVLVKEGTSWQLLIEHLGPRA